MNLAQFEDRHHSVRDILRFFHTDHLPTELKDIAQGFGDLAEAVTAATSDQPQLTTALNLLLQAKDAAVRAVASDTGKVPANDVRSE